MQKKRTNQTVEKGCIVLLVLTFLCINILVADISVPEAAVEIEIQVSKDKIYVGDSIDVHATITLLKDHPNYSEGNEYHVLQLSNYSKLPSGKLLRNKNQLWEVLYSDTTKIVNDENPVVDFFCRIKLAKLPSYKKVDISDITVAEIIEGYLGYEKVNLTKRKKIGKLTIECLNEGLKERPENSNWYEADTSVILSPLKFPPAGNPIDLKSINSPIEIDNYSGIIKKIESSYINQYKEEEGSHVLINSTMIYSFSSTVSNVSCDVSIGNAYKSDSNLITFESGGTVGATGNIYFSMDGNSYYMPIELVENYDIEGSFKYEKTGDDDYENASGIAALVNYMDPSNPSIITQRTINQGRFTFTDVKCPKIGIYLVLGNSHCQIIEGENENDLYSKAAGYGIFGHLEFPNDDKEIDITFTYDYEDYDWVDYNFYLEDEDMAKAHNVFDQAIRAENFSRDYLGNGARSKIYIYSCLNDDCFGDVSRFKTNYVNTNFDFIYIDGLGNDKDQMDNSIILHELGHAYHWEFAEFSFSDYIGEHAWTWSIDDKLAWYEGFATFFSCLVKSETNDVNDVGFDRQYVNTYVVGDPDAYDLDVPTDNPLGNDCEGAVCATLWDIYDNIETGNSAWNDDEICYDYDEIWNIMKNYRIDGRHCYTFNDFLCGWEYLYSDFTPEFKNNYKAHDIVYTPSCSINPGSQIVTTNKIIGCYPNPFSPNTANGMILYSLSHKVDNPQILIYNIRGQKVKTFVVNNQPGSGEVIWDGKNDYGETVQSGVYFQKLINNDKVADVNKILLLK